MDENENGILDNAEVFLDFNNSGSFDSANSLFDGPQCSSDCAATSLHVRSALVLVTSSSAALISLSDSTKELTNNSTLPSLDPVASIARNSHLGLRISFTDTAGQPIPSGSTIEISASSGTLTGQLSTVMPSTNNAAERVLTVNLLNDITPLGDSVQSAITVEITTPSGVSSSLLAFVTLE